MDTHRLSAPAAVAFGAAVEAVALDVAAAVAAASAAVMAACCRPVAAPTADGSAASQAARIQTAATARDVGRKCRSGWLRCGYL